MPITTDGELESCWWRGVLDTTWCNKVCQWLATGQWFFPGPPVSPTNKTDHHDLIEILLKVTLNTITLTLPISQLRFVCFTTTHYEVYLIQPYMIKFIIYRFSVTNNNISHLLIVEFFILIADLGEQNKMKNLTISSWEILFFTGIQLEIIYHYTATK